MQLREMAVFSGAGGGGLALTAAACRLGFGVQSWGAGHARIAHGPQNLDRATFAQLLGASSTNPQSSAKGSVPQALSSRRHGEWPAPASTGPANCRWAPARISQTQRGQRHGGQAESLGARSGAQDQARRVNGLAAGLAAPSRFWRPGIHRVSDGCFALRLLLAYLPGVRWRGIAPLASGPGRMKADTEG